MGLESDPELGTCVAVGMGGVLAEWLGRVAVHAVPLQVGEAAEILTEISVSSLVQSYSGRRPVNRAAVTQMIERVAVFGVVAEPAIRSACA